MSFLKRKTKNYKKDNSYEQDWKFYIDEVWNKRTHMCEVTGKWLGNEPKITYFHHILPKSKYPQYRHESWNIALLHPDVHAQYEVMPEKVPELELRKEELLKWIENEQEHTNNQ